MEYGLLLTQSRLVHAPGGACASVAVETLPGLIGQRCYRALDPAPGSLLVQYFSGAAPVQRIVAPGLAHYRCRELSDSGAVDEVAPVLALVAFDVPPIHAATVERWYNEEHIPLLCRAPGWLRARRYDMVSWSGGPRYTSIALHELRSISVLESIERQYARSTAWRAALEPEPWFAAAGRFIYERVTIEGCT
jgi:hypothetical protein